MHITAGFVGFGEVNTPRELIERKCSLARQALENLGMQLVATAPVCDDPRGENEARARRELSSAPFDLLVVCVAGWIPSHTVIDVVSPFAHLPVVLWGLAGEVVDGRLVTTADQAGTSALRDTFDALGYRYAYVYDTPDEPYAAAKKVYDFATAAAAAARLKTARVGMMGFRDMKLHATLVDGISLRRWWAVRLKSLKPSRSPRRWNGSTRMPWPGRWRNARKTGTLINPSRRLSLNNRCACTWRSWRRSGNAATRPSR
jgi:L-fucose isomerase-like protein